MTTPQPTTWPLSTLMRGLSARDVSAAASDVDVSAVTIDSRRVKPGSVFVACPGAQEQSHHGSAFIDAALMNGAAAIVMQQPLDRAWTVPVFVVDNARHAAAVMVERCHASPSSQTKLVGVTGTNGKTTSTWLLAQLMQSQGTSSAVFGTLGVGAVPHPVNTGFTTPQAETISAQLRALVTNGVSMVAMEVTSHALATARVDGLQFALTAFTNITRDHLDFHGSMSAYYAAKLRLFAELAAGVPSVLPASDDADGYHRQLRKLRPDALTWGHTPAARLHLREVKRSARGAAGELWFDDAHVAFQTPLLGAYNLENLLVACGCALVLGVPLGALPSAIAAATAPPGRLQPVDGAATSPCVVVDYAHTPDALERAALAMREVTPGRLFVVFGCGGDRDAGKRKIMGQVAADVADSVVITDDNPRTESGDAIASSIAEGVQTRLKRVDARALDAGSYTIIRERRFAIRNAIASAGVADTVLIAGKGHEESQVVGARALPFHDATEAALALRGTAAPALIASSLVSEALGHAAAASVADVTYYGVSTDSRALPPRALFVALVGDNHDGHNHVRAALSKGATAAVVNASLRARVAAENPALELFAVPDTLVALQAIARTHLKQQRARRIAVTGSNGKTTCKQLLSAVLGEAFGQAQVVATEGNLNNHIGVPLTALTVSPGHEAAVIEMGMNHFGEIALLADIVQPHVALITNIGTAHAGNLDGTVEGVARAKSEVWQWMATHGGGVAVVNADDPRCVREAQSRSRELRGVSYGSAPWADVRLLGTRDGSDSGQTLSIVVASTAYEVSIPLEGQHNALNACAALAVAVALDLDVRACVAGLSKVVAPPGRMQRVRGDGGAIILDDSYNANPDSMEAGLRTLAEIGARARRIAVLGEMRELGSLAEQAHRNIGAAAVLRGVHTLFACGELGRLYGEGARLQGLADDRFVWAPDSTALGELVKGALKSDDVVLVKGSRGARMERVMDAVAPTRAASRQRSDH